MFFDDQNDSEEKQKWKNLLFFKFYGTNKERDEGFSGLGLFFFVILIILIIIGFFKS